MKGGVVIAFLVLIALFSFRVNAVRINEVELNPPGEDSGNEWIEFYSDSVANLDGWRVENVKGKNLSLNFSFSDYRTIITPYSFLANDKQKLKLFNDKSELVGETEVISDTSNDARSWQYCSDKWIFKNASKGESNKCDEEQIIEEPQNNSSNVNTEEEEPVQEAKKEPAKEENKTITSKAIENSLQEWETSHEEVIKLVPKDIKTWKSQEARIKEYALYGFTLFCFVLLIILIKWRKNIGKELN